MPGFEPWDVVKVPFPYTDRPIRQRRPALIIAAGEIETAHSLLWVLMITSAENRVWPEDVPVVDLSSAGLPAPSVVRCAKVATIDARDAERIGRLARANRGSIARQVKTILAPLKA